MNRAIVVFVLTVSCLSAVFAQDQYGTVEGIVFKSQSEMPLEGVNVVILETSLGDATNRDGAFRIERVPAGEVELEFKLIGYKSTRHRIKVLANRVNEVQIILVPEVLVGSTVTVEGERVDDIRLKITPPTFAIEPQEIQGTAGALEDVMRSLQTLPGFISTGDYSNRFVVRGGGPDQNLILVDDVEIYNPYRSSGMPAPINPAIIQSVSLYAGAYPAIFGDRLSSVLAINTRDGSTSRTLGGRIRLNMLDANFALDGKLNIANGSWLVAGRKTHNQLFAEDYAKRLTLNNVAFPDYEDWHGEMVFRPNERTRLQLHGMYSKNRQDWLVRDELGEQDTERNELDGGDRVENLAVGASLNYQPTLASQIKAYANFYRNNGESGFASDLFPNNDRSALLPDFLPPLPPPLGVADTAAFDYSQSFDFRRASTGVWFVQEAEKHSWVAGFGIDFMDNSLQAGLGLNDFGEVVIGALRNAPNWLGAIADSTNDNTSYQRIHFYAQDKAQLFGGRGYLQPGLRFDFYGLTTEAFLSPRIEFGYQLDTITDFTTSVGVYRQSPGYEKLLDGGRVFDLLRYTNLSQLSSERSIMAVVGVKRWLNDQIRAGVEFYYKHFNNLIGQTVRLTNRPVAVYVSGAPAVSTSYQVREVPFFVNSADPENDGDGQALGLDFLLEKRVHDPSDRWSGRLAYSLGRSTREQTIEGRRVSYAYEFDRRHSINVMLNYRLFAGFSVGASWSYGTGFPYTPALRVEPLVGVFEQDSMLVDVVFEDPVTGYARFVPDFGGGENLNSARLPDYHRLDVRLSYAANIASSQWNFYLDFINVYDRRNVLFYRNIINIEGADDSLPPAFRFPKPVLAREPVYMYPFIPSFGIEVVF